MLVQLNLYAYGMCIVKSMIVVLVFSLKELYHKRELSILTAYAGKLHFRFFSILFWGIFGANSLYMYVV